MKLLEAIAYSPGNKAEGLNDQAQSVVVQERYAYAETQWWHVWHMHQRQVTQKDIVDLADLKIFEVDPDADYWRPIK